MQRTWIQWAVCAAGWLGAASWATADVLRPANERFAAESVTEVPSLQRHVLPLMGRLGCNGRACHGSFQGQGGFRLSLFGYDFKADHEAMTAGEAPRVDLKKVQDSLILSKPSSDDPDEHGGGKRMDVDSWQYRLIRKWVEAGAPKVDEDKDPTFVRMVVTPTEAVYAKPGETTKLHVVAYWSDGTVEDVTPLCRFQSNDDAVAKVDLDGTITCVGKGDTHVVAFYDNGVVPVAVMLPVSDRVGPNFPEVSATTKVDDLVLHKLKKIGVVPSDVCTDAEFLRRVSLDVTGQLPTADEVKAFLADTSADKRSRKIDELLARPAFAAWWATKLCDILGNSENQLRNSAPNGAAEMAYRWVNQRLLDNAHYDDIVEGVVMATGRSSSGQTFEEYCAEMVSYVRKDKPADFTERETMPFYWQRRNMRTANEKALSFSYAFLGVRLQCAECHKHPFDQWSQSDFQHFTAFFDRVQTGTVDRDAAQKILAKLDLPDRNKVGGGQIRNTLAQLASEGTVVPMDEVYVRPATNGGRRYDRSKSASAGRVITPKVLGGDEVVENSDDPRQPLMDWLRQKDNPYFARSFVNRVWAHYFNVGIVEPADDMNLANAPSNKELLDYLSAAFVEHDYDIRWLMREIASSDAYQRSWHTNPTNEFDVRNFSHAVPRRLPAEVVLDAVVAATAGVKEAEERAADPVTACNIGLGRGYSARNNSASYALTVFGKPKRETPCDCERSNEPSLLQTVYLRNDGEMFNLITRRNGWWSQNVQALGQIDGSVKVSRGLVPDSGELKNNIRYIERELKDKESRLAELAKRGKKSDKEEMKKLSDTIAKMKSRIKDMTAEVEKIRKPEPADVTKVAALGPSDLVKEAYLRTFSRLPTDAELAQGETYLKESTDAAAGLRDLLWALMNAKEFVVNH